MKCSVNNCSNDTQTLRKGHGITFHKFPWFRNNWREVLNMEDEPEANSVVCSDHFKSEDIILSKQGEPRIRLGALPIRCRRVQVCRICLATEVRMYRIRDRDLRQAYADVCGMIVEEDNLKDKLPENLCWECSARLLAGSRLRNRAIKSHQLLTQLLHTNPYITLRNIKTINRSDNDLESNLSIHYNDPDDCDMYIEEGISNKQDTEDIIMEIEKIESLEEDDFGEEYLEEPNVVEEVNDNDLINDIEEEYLEQSNEDAEKYKNDNDLLSDCEIIDSDSDENGDDRNELIVLKKEANISDDNEYDDDRRIEINHSDGEENGDDGNELLVLKEEANISDDDEYYNDGRNELNFGDGDSDESFEDKMKIKTSKSNVKVKKTKNVTDDYEYDDDGQSDSNDSDEYIKEKVTVNKRKSNLRVKTPKIKLAKMNQKRNSNAMDKSNPSQVKRGRTDGLDESMFTIKALSLEEQMADAKRRREEPRYKNARYRCDVCGLGFAKINRYELHLAKHSKLAGDYQCAVCARRQKTAAAMKKHLASIHSRRYSCKLCPFVTQTRSVANNHQEWHAGAKFQCKHCPCVFTNRSSYLGHLRYKHRADFICDLCGYAFLSKRGVAIHKNMLHRFIDQKIQLEGPYCETCDVTFLSEEAHERHLHVASQHSQSVLNQIRNDPQNISDKAAQKRVGRRVKIPALAATDKDRTSENGELITCEQCGEKMSGYRLYAVHFRYSHPEKTRTQFSGKNYTVMCDQCGRIFQSTTALKDHLPTHTGNKLFQCDYCCRKFEQKSNLADHIARTNHRGEITFQCDKCEKKFSKKSTFLAHLKTHVRYNCNICGREFMHPSNCKRHMWTHSAQKPVKCEACDKTFTNPSVQKAHFKHEHLKKPWPPRKKYLPP